MDSEGRKKETEIRCRIWLGEFKNGELNIIKEIRLCLLTEDKQQNFESVEDNFLQFN